MQTHRTHYTYIFWRYKGGGEHRVVTGILNFIQLDTHVAHPVVCQSTHAAFMFFDSWVIHTVARSCFYRSRHFILSCNVFSSLIFIFCFLTYYFYQWDLWNLIAILCNISKWKLETFRKFQTWQKYGEKFWD